MEQKFTLRDIFIFLTHPLNTSSNVRYKSLSIVGSCFFLPRPFKPPKPISISCGLTSYSSEWKFISLYYKRQIPRKRFTKDQKAKKIFQLGYKKSRQLLLFFETQLQKNRKLPLKKWIMKYLTALYILSWTSSERLMYLQFTSCVYGVLTFTELMREYERWHACFHYCQRMGIYLELLHIFSFVRPGKKEFGCDLLILWPSNYKLFQREKKI